MCEVVEDIAVTVVIPDDETNGDADVLDPEPQTGQKVRLEVCGAHLGVTVAATATKESWNTGGDHRHV